MDWSKYALDKLVYFVAGIVPGFVALLVFQLSHPGLLDSFFRLSYLGYRTKLAFVLLVCFAVGLTITTMVRGLIGAGWAVYTDQTKNQRPYQPSSTFPIAPWRDPRWRTVLAKHLGTGVPNDTVLILPEIFETRRQMVELLPANEQPRALHELTSEKLGTEKDDLQWEQWYDHYHQIVLQPSDRDLFFHVGWGLRINFEAAALYVLIAAFFVRPLRHWWLIAPSCLWVFMLIAEEYTGFRKGTNKWDTLSAQIKYLSDWERNVQQSLF